MSIIGGLIPFTDEPEDGQPDIVVDKLTVSPNVVRGGGTVSIKIDLRNKGSLEGSKEVKFRIENDNFTENFTIEPNEWMVVSYSII